MLNQTDIRNNNNKFYAIQLLEDDNAPRFYTYTRWGRGACVCVCVHVVVLNGVRRCVSACSHASQLRVNSVHSFFICDAFATLSQQSSPADNQERHAREHMAMHIHVNEKDQGNE